MLLAADVGNTNIKLAIFDGDKLKFKLVFSTDKSKTSDEFAVELYTFCQIYKIDVNQIDASIIGSVVPHITEPLKNAIKTVTGIESLVTGPGIRTGLDIRLDNPSAVGSDIVCICVAIKKLYPCPAIIAGLGTATTILYVNENRTYAGGAILPGIQIALDALSSRCALLPSVDISTPKKTIGTNTADCIKSGVVYGNASMIDGMIERFEQEAGQKCTLVATGGLASSIVGCCKHNIIINDDLVLEGLRIIYEKNAR